MFQGLAEIIILSIIQGITEFLPISSSAHLAVMEKLLKIEDPVLVAVVLHAGTLVSIIIIYLKELIALIKPGGCRLIPKIITGTLPVGIIGILFHIFNIADLMFENMFVIGGGLFFTAFILLYGTKRQSQSKSLDDISFKDSFIIGVLQSFAILPGISRSGTTIAGALKLGYKRQDSATFSFFLAIPAVAGASIIKGVSCFYLSKTDSVFSGISIFSLAAGFIISAFVGYAALNTILESVRKGKLTGYAYYCFVLGIILIAWQLWEFLSQISGIPY